MKIMKIFLLIVFTIILSPPINAQNLKEKLIVSSMSYSTKRKLYRITFLEKAAFYNAPEKWEKCLYSSIKKQKKVEVSYHPLKMLIINCKY